MKRIVPKIRLLTYQQSPETGTEVTALVLEYQGNNYHLEGGTKDIIHVFSQSICLYVLTINRGLGYLTGKLTHTQCSPCGSTVLVTAS